MKKLKLNLPQAHAVQMIRKYKAVMNQWGRGTGKTFFLALYFVFVSLKLPRSSCFLYSKSYVYILDTLLPSFKASLAKLGWIEDIHYVIGKKPPAKWNWPRPYAEPNDYKRCIYTYTGAVWNIVSERKTKRGANYDAGMCDEMQMLDKQQFDESCLLSLRGSSDAFFGKPFHESVVYTGTVPRTPIGAWVKEFIKEARLDKTTGVTRFSSFSNRENLSPGFFEKQKKILGPAGYDAEIRNIMPDTIDVCFYPKMGNIKQYVADNISHLDNNGITNNCLQDSDVDLEKPLLIGLDFGAAINCLVTSQNHDRDFLILKNMWVKAPKIIDDLANKWCDYYYPMTNRLIYIYCDPAGNNKTGVTKVSPVEQFADVLIARGWTVVIRTKGGSNAKHHDKYDAFNQIFSPTYYTTFHMNKTNCEELIISMSNAGVVEKNGKIHKDKSSERRKGEDVKREHATDLSDALDAKLYQLFGKNITPNGVVLPSNTL